MFLVRPSNWYTPTKLSYLEKVKWEQMASFYRHTTSEL